MTRAGLSWLDDDRMRLIELMEGRPCTIGRDPRSATDLGDPSKQHLYGTVSRRHAEVRPQGGAFVVAHLSQTNPTRVNNTDVPADRPRRLADHDVIRVGRLRLTFHDLAAGDHLSGILCPSCHRENDPSRHDCWYDGTNLAGAVSTARHQVKVACRLVAGDGQTTDLFDTRPHENVAILADGKLDRHPRQPGVAAISIGQPGPKLSASVNDTVTVNSQPLPAEGQVLRSGDEVRAAGSAYLIIVR